MLTVSTSTVSTRVRRALVLGAVAAAAVGVVQVAAPAEADIAAYANCRLYNSSADYLSAYCDEDAPGTQYQVVVRCTNNVVVRGPWRNQGGTYSSSAYCPGSSSVRDGSRAVR